MKKNRQEKRELSEEQLHEITGGCAQCLTDLDTVARLQRRAEGAINGPIQQRR